MKFATYQHIKSGKIIRLQIPSKFSDYAGFTGGKILGYKRIK